MRIPNWLFLFVLIGVGILAAGCAKDARDTTGFTVSETATISVPLEDAWQMTKTVLRERDYDLYTRDKRGVFVAFSQMKREMLVAPKRSKFTIALEAVSKDSTSVTVEGVRQVYGVTLLTYPGWHDRKMSDPSEVQDILAAIQAKSGTEGGQPEPAEASPASES